MRLTARIIAAAALVAAAVFAAEGREVDVIPAPADMRVDPAGEGFALPASLRVGATTGADKKAAAEVASALSRAGFKAAVGSAPSVKLASDKELGPEAYKLAVKPGGITITASGDAGFFYGAQTLVQLLRQAENGRLPELTITDSPRFAYRGAMIDVVRCFQPIDELKKMIDVCASLKLNNLHLHLTDDNGWRLEIKGYPRLTKVGAWRVDYPDLMFPARPNQRSADEPTTYGGYYTQREMRDLVKYAAERHVNIIPEIEMPAHAAAAIASYPELACEGVDKFVGVFPGIGGKDASIIMCAGRDSTFQFVERVLDEVMDIFPSKQIHIGGDEANKHYWQQCARCAERMAQQGLDDCEQLQGYFMDRVIAYLREHGREAIGWDEVTLGKPKEDITVMGWRGDGAAAVHYAVETGRQFIMTPAKTLYMIRYQGPQWFEPFTYFGNNLLSSVYAYEPIGGHWDPAIERQLKGIQGSLWSEFCRTPADMERLLYPRMVALADAAWRPKGTADWPRFAAALDRWLPTLDAMGVEYSRAMFNPQHTARPTGDGRVTVLLECERPDVKLMWGADEQMALPAPYDGPATIERTTTLHASTFAPDGSQQLGKTLTLDLEFNKATGRKVSTLTPNNGLDAVLTNGLRGSNRNSDFEWAGWHNDVAQFVVDLGAPTDINSITLGTLANANLCIAAPAEVYFYISDNGSAFTPVGSVKPAESFANVAESVVEDLTLEGIGGRGRYVKVVAVNPGCVPDGLPREGSPTWMYFDELIVK